MSGQQTISPSSPCRGAAQQNPSSLRDPGFEHCRHGHLTGFGRRPNPVFSDEYGAIRSVLVCARADAGVSQRELAKRLGKARSHVARVESGERRIDTLELWTIANCLGMDARELFNRIVLGLEALGEQP